MILYVGIKTTNPVRFAYKPLAPGEKDAKTIVGLRGDLTGHEG